MAGPGVVVAVAVLVIVGVYVIGVLVNVFVGVFVGVNVRVGAGVFVGLGAGFPAEKTLVVLKENSNKTIKKNADDLCGWVGFAIHHSLHKQQVKIFYSNAFDITPPLLILSSQYGHIRSGIHSW